MIIKTCHNTFDYPYFQLVDKILTDVKGMIIDNAEADDTGDPVIITNVVILAGTCHFIKAN